MGKVSKSRNNKITEQEIKILKKKAEELDNLKVIVISMIILGAIFIMGVWVGNR